MRVLHVIPSVAPRYGGPSSAIAPMCRALIAQGLTVHLVTTDADGPGRLDVPVDADTMWNGVPTSFVRRQATESFKYSRAMTRWLDVHVSAYDVVHVHALLSHAPLAAAAACRRAHVPYIVRPLGTLASWSLERKAWKKQLLLALGGRAALQGAAAVHCTSEEERVDLERTFGVSTGVVIPLGIDPALADVPASITGARQHDRYVLALSRLHPKKNFGLLIEAFLAARATADVPWRLVIAGTGDDRYEQQLKEQVSKAGAQSLVNFAGWVDGETKRRLIQGASLFALPSLHENFGIAVLEALAAGVPAIVSRDVHLAADITAADAGWEVDGTRGALTSALQTAMTDEQRRADRGRAAAVLATRYGWPAIAARLAATYTAVRAGAQRGTTIPAA